MKYKSEESCFYFTISETKRELLLSLVFAVVLFKDTLKQGKIIFLGDPTIIIVLVSRIHHLNSHFPLTIRMRTGLSSS